MQRTRPWEVSDELWERVKPLIPEPPFGLRSTALFASETYRIKNLPERMPSLKTRALRQVLVSLH
jgi:transposase